MSSRRTPNPKYRHYKPKNLGVVRIDGKDYYLGTYDSPESWEKYHRLIAEWLSRKAVRHEADPSEKSEQTNGSVSINELLLAYWQFAESYYSHDGEPTAELNCMRDPTAQSAALSGPSGPCRVRI
jgi:hypothetical protein